MTSGGDGLYCLQCVSEVLQFEARQARGEIPELAAPPSLREAITLAPSWQQQSIMGQMVMACVAVPTCKEHLQVKEVSPQDRALLGGKLIPGRVNQQ
jgi:hypothetical protein